MIKSELKWFKIFEISLFSKKVIYLYKTLNYALYFFSNFLSFRNYNQLYEVSYTTYVELQIL